MIYLDHAATTPVRPEVVEAMNNAYQNFWGNPSSLYSIGRKSKDKIFSSKKKIAQILNCQAEEIIFTSGGTESDNLAILGIAQAQKKGHIITSSLEHHAVLKTVKNLEKNSFQVTYIKPDEKGIISPKKIEKALQKDTFMVSVMSANNEIGTINPIAEIAHITKKHKIFFHTDAVQAAGFLNLDVQKLGVDALSLSAHKFYGPKGVGALFLKKSYQDKIIPHMFGGSQEFGLRPSTENISGIIGLTTALELAEKEKKKEVLRLTKLRDLAFKLLKKEIPDIVINGDLEKRLPNNINISIPKIEGESLLLYLDQKEIFVSTGSACTSDSLEPSHVLKAIKTPANLLHSSIRLSLGKSNQEKDIYDMVKILTKIVQKLRRISCLK